MKKAEWIDPVAYVLIGVVTIFFSRQYDAEYYTIGPGFFPMMIAFLMIAINSFRVVLLLIKSVSDPPVFLPMTKAAYHSFFIILSALTAYFICNFFLGFLVSTSIFVFIMMYLLGNHSIWQNAVFSLLVSISISAVFKWILVLPLPQGMLF